MTHLDYIRGTCVVSTPGNPPFPRVAAGPGDVCHDEPEGVHSPSEVPVKNTMRVPPRLWAQAEKLLPLLQAQPGVADVLGGEVRVAAVLRAALARGLRSMEREYTEEPVPLVGVVDVADGSSDPEDDHFREDMESDNPADYHD